jgi:hypothetical protein
MEWVKNSVVAPSYNLNYNALNLVPLLVYCRFHPLLRKRSIFTMIENFPFVINSTFSMKNFGLDVFIIIVIPKPYLKDVISLFDKLEDSGYIISHNYMRQEYVLMNANLNYYREYMRKNILANPQSSLYTKKHEVETKIEYGNKFFNPELNLLDFLILDRIQWFSVTGLGFERRDDVLRSIKQDLINENTSERAIIKDLKYELEYINESEDLKNGIIQFLKKNEKFGFFYIKQMLEEFNVLTVLIENYLNKNIEVNSIAKFQEILKNGHISHLLEKNNLLKNSLVKKTLINEVLNQYFNSKTAYKHYIERLERINRIFALFTNLKIFSINSIKRILMNHKLLKQVFESKEQKLKNEYEKYRTYQITTNKIDEVLDKFLDINPPIIVPKLVKTLPSLHSINDYCIMFMVESPENLNKLKNLKNIFPLFDIRINRNERIINIEIFLPYLTNYEKGELFSIFYNTFQRDIIFAHSLQYSGYFPAFSIKNFYDYNKKEFFYTKDLFTEYLKYTKEVFGNVSKSIKIIPFKSQEIFWSKNKDITKLVKIVNSRYKSENYNYSKIYLNKLTSFNYKIQELLLNRVYYNEIKNEFFFKNYVKSIRIIPAFHVFGFSQYYLYLYPSDMNRIDLKLLLLNSFQKIRCANSIDKSKLFLIKYIMPYNRPNKSYLNRIVKSDKIIREYCLFTVKKLYVIIQFDRNLDSKGWSYSIEKFKSYLQNVLFNTNYKIQIPRINEFEIELKSITSYFHPNSSEFQDLSMIYGIKSSDIRSYIGSQKSNFTNATNKLLKKGLIFPYLKLKNLNLHNKILIILPNVKPEFNIKILKIFYYFNYGFIYKIQGEYFIQGLPKEIKFKNGFMIKLYLPMFKHHEFMKFFDLLFDFLEIKNYLILSDLVDGKEVLRSIYKNLDFLDLYNPLRNLKWNENDKIWMNYKLYTQNFKKIYPELL